MTDGQLRFPQWQAPLQDLILEFDSIKLEEKTRAVEALLFERIRQLDLESDGRDEKMALRDALSIIRIMKRDRPEPSQSE